MTWTLPAGLPSGTEDLYRSFYPEDPRTRAELMEDLETYLAHLYSLDSEVVDLKTASALGAALKELIETADEDQLPYVEAATLYFVDEEDEGCDTASPEGFDDDVAVFHATCRHLGRTDLILNW